ncbi:MAG: hypothetical protein WCI73_11560, partial [Phycisphaerae bacterium]
YGLLPLALGRWWFGLFGRTPLAYEWLTLVWGAIMVLGMVRLARAWDWNWWQTGLGILALPIALPTFYLNQTHVIEAAILVHALAAQARGRRTTALALMTVCLFIKPSLAYVYGLLLVSLILLHFWIADPSVDLELPPSHKPWWRNAWTALWPAAAMGVLLAIGLGLMFGWQPLWQTLLPLHARASYRAANFGFFFGVGRAFWIRPWPEYFTTIAGFWLGATLVLAFAAVAAVVQDILGLGRRAKIWKVFPTAPIAGGRLESWLCLATLHLTFVFFLFAWKDSWVYYSYLPVLGIVTAVGWMVAAKPGIPPARRRWWPCFVIAVFVALAISGQWSRVAEAYWSWNWPHTPQTAGLWTYRELAADFIAVRQATAGRQTFWLVNGDLDEMCPGIQTADSWFLSPALPLPREIADVRRRMAEAEVVVRFRELGDLDPWRWDDFAAERAAFGREQRIGHFILEYRASRP